MSRIAKLLAVLVISIMFIAANQLNSLALSPVKVSPVTAVTSAEDAKSGAKLFAETCKICHHTESSDTLVGPGLKGLYKDRKKMLSGKAVTDDNVKNLIQKGRNAMPAYKGKFNAAQLADLIAYLKTL
jgi:mono/diheme cytochrome c family protein